MNMYGWALVIFVTFVMVPLAVAWWMGRNPPIERTTLLARLEEGIGRTELPRAGLLPLDRLPASGPSGPWLEPDPAPPGYRFAYCQPLYGPFPVDTRPLLLLSEQAAANVALEREIRQRCAEAEAKIPPRWR